MDHYLGVTSEELLAARGEGKDLVAPHVELFDLGQDGLVGLEFLLEGLAEAHEKLAEHLPDEAVVEVRVLQRLEHGPGLLQDEGDRVLCAGDVLEVLRGERGLGLLLGLAPTKLFFD